MTVCCVNDSFKLGVSTFSLTLFGYSKVQDYVDDVENKTFASIVDDDHNMLLHKQRSSSCMN